METVSEIINLAYNIPTGHFKKFKKIFNSSWKHQLYEAQDKVDWATLLVGQFTRRVELYVGSRQKDTKEENSLGPLELTAHLGTWPRYTHTHTCACTHIAPKWNSHTAQWMTMSVAKTEYTNEGWCQSCFWQNHLISRDLSLNRKLPKCLENCDKKIPGPMDNSWFFKARPTFDYILKLTSTKEKQKQLFENKFTL